MNILLGISGGIAAYKTPELVRALQKQGETIRCAITPTAASFVSPLVLETLTRCAVMQSASVHSGSIDHIAYADWADLMIIAPATAETLARCAGGHANEPVSLSFLAAAAPKIIFPAMNVNMWRNSATQRNVATLRKDDVTVIDPASGELACGWTGEGRLPDIDDILAVVTEQASVEQVLSGKRLLVTAGPTREFIDPVRFLGNPSTGRMGFAIALEAAKMGAEVILVAGPTELPTPAGVHRVNVVSAAEMLQAVDAEFDNQTIDIFIAAAAVADFTPETPRTEKTKKAAANPMLPLKPTVDILATMVDKYRPTVAVGFAAETSNVVENARKKLLAKKLTLVVANDVSDAAIGFASANNQVTLISETRTEKIEEASKEVIAAQILHEVQTLI